jgi:hypothetical protein
LFWRFVLRAHPRALPLPHFSFGTKHLSHTHTPLCETRFVYLCSSSLHSILFITRYNLCMCCMCVFVVAVGVALSVALQCGSI